VSYTIEGVWTGYTSAQRQVAHREHTRSEERIEEIRKLGSILYTDGTKLLLRVLEGKQGEPIDGYSKLIADCLRHGVNSVDALPSD
jgi:hypothetical protein